MCLVVTVARQTGARLDCSTYFTTDTVPILRLTQHTPAGEVLKTLLEVDLPQPSKKDMRFEIYKEVKSPAEPAAAVYFEVRFSKNGKVQPTKYWATLSCQDMEHGDRVLQVLSLLALLAQQYKD